MKQVRWLGLALVAALALGALAASGASAALPEWGQCVRFENRGKPAGRYNDSNCTEANTEKKGNYEFRNLKMLEKEGFATEFTSNGGKAELSLTLGIKTVCGNEKATGRLSGTKEVSNVEVIFQGCKSNFGEVPCNNALMAPFGEEPAEQIRTRSLKGKLVYVSGKGTSEPVVGITLEPEQEKGLFAEFTCAGFLTVRVGQAGYDGTGITKNGPGNDSIIGFISPVNKMGITLAQTYKLHKNEAGEEENGIQEPLASESGVKDYLETEISDGFGEIPFSQSAQKLETVNVLNSNKSLEVKA